MIWGITQVDGWYFTNKWRYYQKTSGKVVSYIELMYGFYRVHVTFRGQLGMCDIEYRAEEFEKALEKAEEFLGKYKDIADKRELQKDYWSPHNPDGYWQQVY